MLDVYMSLWLLFLPLLLFVVCCLLFVVRWNRRHKLDINQLEVEVRCKSILKEVVYNLNASRLAIVAGAMCSTESQLLFDKL
ncbi:hypothetical protein [Vibrio maerlii]|uniref:hypothetical protein n=1 Tax=Vibrio maerlii TaxID=2231648 RepID=UPI000E3ED4D9|nr:hypothetical protein [Vibrio maerlii]